LKKPLSWQISVANQSSDLEAQIKLLISYDVLQIKILVTQKLIFYLFILCK